MQVGKDTHALGVGHKALAPIDSLHRFRNPTDEPVKFLVEPRPGSPQGLRRR